MNNLFESGRAVFSDDRAYRYTLEREWDKSKFSAMFIGLNPSTADADKNDPTVTRCVNYANSWGYGGIVMTNIFAFRATDPKVMRSCGHPIGNRNDEYLLSCAADPKVAVIVCCWGAHGEFMNRGRDVLKLLADFELTALDITKSGQPKHPLYLTANLKPLKYRGSRVTER